MRRRPARIDGLDSVDQDEFGRLVRFREKSKATPGEILQRSLKSSSRWWGQKVEVPARRPWSFGPPVRSFDCRIKEGSCAVDFCS
jgi:hypothetical protein